MPKMTKDGKQSKNIRKIMRQITKNLSAELENSKANKTFSRFNDALDIFVGRVSIELEGSDVTLQTIQR